MQHAVDVNLYVEKHGRAIKKCVSDEKQKPVDKNNKLTLRSDCSLTPGQKA
jgi:hypothetical protein